MCCVGNAFKDTGAVKEVERCGFWVRMVDLGSEIGWGVMALETSLPRGRTVLEWTGVEWACRIYTVYRYV
jgi:hypothetical protein